MSRYNTPFEIHVHGEVPLRADVSFEQLQEALKPLWKYAGSRSLAAGAASVYEEEPGIRFDAPKHLLQMCWTVPGDDDFRQALDEMCMGLNDLAEAGGFHGGQLGLQWARQADGVHAEIGDVALHGGLTHGRSPGSAGAAHELEAG